MTIARRHGEGIGRRELLRYRTETDFLGRLKFLRVCDADPICVGQEFLTWAPCRGTGVPAAGTLVLPGETICRG